MGNLGTGNINVVLGRGAGYGRELSSGRGRRLGRCWAASDIYEPEAGIDLQSELTVLQEQANINQEKIDILKKEKELIVQRMGKLNESINNENE